MQGLPDRLRAERFTGMPLIRAGRGCGALIVHVVLVATLGIVALSCVANRSWIEEKIVSAVYQDRPKIHAGERFTPGATAREDGVRQTAVLVHGDPHVRVTSPTKRWRANHEDATCRGDVCTAAATPQDFLGEDGIDIAALPAGLLACYLVWALLIDNDSPRHGRKRRNGYDRHDQYDRYDD